MGTRKVESIPEIPTDTQLTETNFYHCTETMVFSPREIAFVMVDLWNTGFGPQPLSHLGWEAEYNAGKSFCDRAGAIERTRILPILNACREQGIDKPVRNPPRLRRHIFIQRRLGIGGMRSSRRPRWAGV